MPVHVAITRRVRPGCEAEFQAALLEFMQESFAHGGVMGAQLIVPPPGSASKEIGILRSFRDEKERDDFYASPMFLAWEARARTMTEGEPEYRQVHGLEAWFRGPRTPPPRWKMAAATLLGVYPTSLLLVMTVGKAAKDWPLAARSFVVSACMVAALTWVVMPLLVRVLLPWLNRQANTPRG